MKKNRFKTGDMLIKKTGNLNQFYFVVSSSASGEYLCREYTVQSGLLELNHVLAERALKGYRCANALEYKVCRFIQESGGGLSNLKGDLYESRLFKAFCSKLGSTEFTIEDKTGAKRKFKLLSNSPDTGTQHILTKHFLGKVGRLEYSDIMMLLTVIKKGEVESSGKDFIYTYKCASSRKTYKLICFIKSAKEGKVFLIKSYYSNKK